MERIPLFRKLLIEIHSDCNRRCFFCSRTWDNTGRRLLADGTRVVRSMPTEHVLRIMDEAAGMGFRGAVGFHQWNEPFMDPRLIELAWEARKRGLAPYVHTNGDLLRKNHPLCRQAAEVFGEVTVGLYDATSALSRATEKTFWRQRLRGTKVRFSLMKNVFPRAIAPYDERMCRKQRAYPSSPCHEPELRLVIHYNGNMSLCCEDLWEEFGLGNAFETSVHDLWHSEAHTRILQDLRAGRRANYRLCSRCPHPHRPWRQALGTAVRALLGRRAGVVSPP